MLTRSCGLIVLLMIILSSVCQSAQTRTLPAPIPQKIDPSSLQLSVILDVLGAAGSPLTVKQNASVTLRCSWKAQFVKPVLLQTPVNLQIVLAEDTSGVQQLSQTSATIKAGNYTFPGMAAQGELPFSWKAVTLGNHSFGCLVANTNPEWTGSGVLGMKKVNRIVQVEPDKFKFCPVLYPVLLTKNPKGDQSGAIGEVKPVELMLVIKSSQPAGNQFICHYRSQKDDVPDVTLTVSCPGATPLPVQTGQMLTQYRYACND